MRTQSTHAHSSPATPRSNSRKPSAAPSAGPVAGDGALGTTEAAALLDGPSRDEMIRARAYERYERNGCVEGRDVDDWLSAEAEVVAMMEQAADGSASVGV
jgi:hypothetical protein